MRRWLQPRAPLAVTAVMVGERCLVARVEGGQEGSPMRLTQLGEGGAGELRRWKAERWFERSQVVLVLGGKDRLFLTLDRPPVPVAELGMAVRFPLAEAGDAAPEQLLSCAVPLPRINEASKAQVLAVAGRLDPVREQLATLAAAGIRARSIDVNYTALRGMVLLQPTDEDGWIAAALIGGEMCIGLVWRGEFCALRTLALPTRPPRDPKEFEDQLALHIQRTADLFERQARMLAVRHVLASLPSMAATARESVRAALPLTPSLFDLGAGLEMSAAARTLCATDNDLTALACVAAARLWDARNDQLADAAAAAAASEASA